METEGFISSKLSASNSSIKNPFKVRKSIFGLNSTAGVSSEFEKYYFSK
jgi:hypothetical protein